MAGPTCVVLSAQSCADASVDELIRLVGNEKEGADFRVYDTRPLGGSYVGKGRPFLLFSEPRDEHEIDAITEAFGWTPRVEIGLAAMCNGNEDHRILGEMALWLSEKLSGAVDLCGEIPFAPGLAGKSASIAYETVNGDVAHYSVVGPDGLRAWLDNADFRIAK